MGFKIIFIFTFLLCINHISGDDDLNKKRFPATFAFGAATSAYQVEGAWNGDGKGESNWDRFVHSSSSTIRNHDTGDIACDSYHKYKEDVALLKEIGAKYYRFSISWTRILPTGYSNQINQAGIQYYKNLIKELKDNNIEPLVTIFHWDTPQSIEQLGGFLNDYIVDKFADFADICFKNFGDNVKFWLTFNEPFTVCRFAYGAGGSAPNIKSSGIGDYLCAHNMLKAHAKAWHLYDKLYRSTQKGVVGIALNTDWSEPDSASEDDINAAERCMQFGFGWYANPIFKGDYPSVMKSVVNRRSANQGFKQSRLPAFTKEEIEYINGTIDYLGLNYYSAKMVLNKVNTDYTTFSYETDLEIDAYTKPEWESAASGWIKVVPWGLRKVLNWIKQHYGDIPILITENGFSDFGDMQDDRRINYIQQHLSKLRDSLDDGVNVVGYTVWSLMDNFEWQDGYAVKFGLYHVDFNDGNRTRTPKKSVEYVKSVFATRCIVDNSECHD